MNTRASSRNVDFASPHVALFAKANCHDETVPFSAALILVASSNVHATEAIFFNGGGYTIEILVGMAPDSVIASVRFSPPGAKDWLAFPASFFILKSSTWKREF